MVRHTTTTVRIMTTIENLLKKLDGVRVHTAGTGSIYVYYNNLKVRVSDHEPNFGAPNRHNDKCFYLKDIDGQIFDIYNVVEEVAEYLEIEIKGTLKGMITKHLNAEMKLSEERFKFHLAAEKEREEAVAVYNAKCEKLKAIVDANKEEVEKMWNEADAYGDQASNGDKRRKRRSKMFNRLFTARFGFEPINLEIRKYLMNE
ncbi:hypothetical protein KZY75_04140 [Prevotella salivae]|nr:hypothetical protein [Segatella salivae]